MLVEHLSNDFSNLLFCHISDLSIDFQTFRLRVGACKKSRSNGETKSCSQIQPRKESKNPIRNRTIRSKKAITTKPVIMNQDTDINKL